MMDVGLRITAVMLRPTTHQRLRITNRLLDPLHLPSLLSRLLRRDSELLRRAMAIQQVRAMAFQQDRARASQQGRRRRHHHHHHHHDPTISGSKSRHLMSLRLVKWTWTKITMTRKRRSEHLRRSHQLRETVLGLIACRLLTCRRPPRLRHKGAHDVLGYVECKDIS
jgi:hypothetical protein